MARFFHGKIKEILFAPILWKWFGAVSTRVLNSREMMIVSPVVTAN